ncbi:MAG: hypothetical protein E7J78_01265, partial [Pantoea sp.]|nr:hypothetical protein [Pantoea sp.]
PAVIASRADALRLRQDRGEVLKRHREPLAAGTNDSSPFGVSSACPAGERPSSLYPTGQMRTNLMVAICQNNRGHDESIFY